MLEWSFIVAGWILLLGGVVIAWCFGWRDRGKGTRRCPKCWYDMRATAGLRCPECGSEATKESKLFRSHRRWRWIAAGIVLLVASYPVFRWPLYQKDGVIGFVPRFVVLAFFPEISQQIKVRLPRTTPREIALVQKLAKNAPLWIWERALLAKSFARMLDERSRNPQMKIEILRETPLLGAQASIAMPAITRFMEEDDLSPSVWQLLQTFAYSLDYHPLTTPVASAIARNPMRLDSFPAALDLLRSWNADEDQLRRVLTAAIKWENDSLSVCGAEHLWRLNLLRRDDAPMLLAKKPTPRRFSTDFVAYCLADVGSDEPEILERARVELRSTDSQRALAGCVLLEAASNNAEAALADLDAIQIEKDDECLRNAAYFTSASTRGRLAKAARAYSLASRVVGPNGANSCRHIAALIYYSSMPVDEKARQLAEIVDLGRSQVGSWTTPYSLEYAVTFLAKLGTEARVAIPCLMRLCEPKVMADVQSNAMDAILRIGLSSRKEADELAAALSRMQSATKVDAAMQWRLDLLEAKIREFDKR
ncbi:MAG: hypothetical protein ACREJD_14915 [Phycisphaerales bacterium]